MENNVAGLIDERRDADRPPSAAHTYEDFTYATLPDARSWIRLLELSAGVEDDPISGSISIWPVSAAPTYHAISYVWGDPAATTTIQIDGRRLEVRTNCRDVLHQARYHGRSCYYWVDAICINQADLDEKSHQVEMMGSIFEAAAHVHACIGPHAADSEFVLRILNTFPRHLLARPVPAWPRVRSNGRASLWLLAHSKDEIARLSKGVAALLSRPYFTRVWILQEVFRKQARTSLCCGNDRQRFDALFALLHAFRWIPLNADGGFFPLEKFKALADWVCGGRFAAVDPRYRFYDYPSASASFALDVSFPGQRRSNRASRCTTEDGRDGLEEVIGMLKSFQCQDPRDRIYGTLPLVDWEAQSPVVPDYRKTRFQLALEVLLLGWERGRCGSLVQVVELAMAFSLEVEDEETDGILRAYRHSVEEAASSGAPMRAKEILLVLWQELKGTEATRNLYLRKDSGPDISSVGNPDPDPLVTHRPTLLVQQCRVAEIIDEDLFWIGFRSNVRIAVLISLKSDGPRRVFEVLMTLEAQNNSSSTLVAQSVAQLFDVVFDPQEALVLAIMLAARDWSQQFSEHLSECLAKFRRLEESAHADEMRIEQRRHLLDNSGGLNVFVWRNVKDSSKDDGDGEPRLLSRWQWPGVDALRRIRRRGNT